MAEHLGAVTLQHHSTLPSLRILLTQVEEHVVGEAPENTEGNTESSTKHITLL